MAQKRSKKPKDSPSSKAEREKKAAKPAEEEIEIIDRRTSTRLAQQRAERERAEAEGGAAAQEREAPAGAPPEAQAAPAGEEPAEKERGEAAEQPEPETGASPEGQSERPAEQAAEKEPEPPFGAQTAEEQEAVDAETLRALIPDDVYQVLRTNLQVLAGLAWVKLGLIPSPKTNEISKDLTQAKAAIDAVASIVDILQPVASEGELKEYKNLLQTLRLNFVQQQSAQGQ